MKKPNNDKQERYKPTIYDGVGAVLVVWFAWYVDLHDRIAAVTDPIVRGLFD